MILKTEIYFYKKVIHIKFFFIVKILVAKSILILSMCQRNKFNTIILDILSIVKIFVSYSRRDAGDFADQIQRHLSSFKYDIFTDVNSIKVGEIWSNTIEENISNCDVFVVIVTHGALLSPHVEREVMQAQREKKKIIPCFLRGLNPNRIKWGLEKIQGVEFNDKYELARNLYSKIDIESNIPGRNEPTFPNPQDQSGGKLGTLYRFSNKKSIIAISITIISIIAIIGVVIGIGGLPPPAPPSPPVIDNGIIEPNNETAITPNVDTLFSSALESYKISQYSNAIDSLNKVLQIEPNNVTAQFLKGSSLYEVKNYSDAANSFTKVLQIEPNNVTAQFLKGSSLYEGGNYNNAHESFQQLIQLDPNNTKALYYNGLSLYNLERYSDAISELNRVLALEPSNKDALLYKGLSLFNLERYNEAIMQFNRVLALEPSNKDALLYKGLSLFNLERYDEAIAYYDRILEIDPNNINATQEKERTIQQIQQNQSSTSSSTTNINNN
jgi:tetratricopeptide (TPR) repeat protein